MNASHVAIYNICYPLRTPVSTPTYSIFAVVTYNDRSTVRHEHSTGSDRTIGFGCGKDAIGTLLRRIPRRWIRKDVEGDVLGGRLHSSGIDDGVVSGSGSVGVVYIE